MSVDDLKVYWMSWAKKQTQGDPFSFLSDREGRQEQEQEQEQEEQEEQEKEQEEAGRKGQDGDEEDTLSITMNKSHPSLIPGSGIDGGISLPCECDTPAARTACLQQLAPEWGGFKTAFHSLIGLVDQLEVSPECIT